MKKFTLFFVFALLGVFTLSSYAQTLNQSASWPNPSWALTGTYNSDPSALEADPTVSANFAFDDDDAGNGSDDDIAAESPIIDLTAASAAGETWLSVTVDYTYNDLADTLTLEYWDADAGAWVSWEQFGPSADQPNDNFCSGTRDTFTSIILNIAPFTATQLSGFRYRISFLDDGGAGGAAFEWGFCFDAPTITSATPPSCPDPVALSVSAVSDTTANLAWTETGTATAWDVEILTSGTPPTGVPTAASVTNPYTATALTPNTAYDFYVRANCGVDGTSAWVGPFTFTTACAAFMAPYTENFETFTTATTAFTSENCWSGTGGAYYWESAPGTDNGSGNTGPDPSITTGNYFYIEASGGSAGSTTDLLSPLVDLTPLTAPALLFDYHMFGVQIGTLEVIVNGTTTVWTLSGEQQTTATAPFEQAAVDLSAYAGQIISVTFRGTSVGTFEGDIAIDNVSFTELPSCIAPNTLTATNIDGFSADLGWTENGTATVWNVELVDVTAMGTATGTATNTAVANPFNITGLTPENDYEFYVQADCGVDGTSLWAGPFAFTTTAACGEVTEVTFFNTDSDSTNMSWTSAEGSPVSYNVEFVPFGNAQGVGVISGNNVPEPGNAISSGPFYMPDTQYDAWIQTVCGSAGTSAYAGPFTFRTACAPFMAPYTEDFETFTTSSGAFAAENCWSATGGSYFWESAAGTDLSSGGTGPDPTITTGNYFFTEASAGASGDITDLVSPAVDLTPLTAPALLFDYHMFGGQMGTLEVLVNGTTTEWTLSGQQQTSATDPFELAVVDLAAYAGQTISVTFRGTSVGTFEGDIAIDNVSFTEFPACAAPNLLTATNITDTTADLGWTENGTAMLWDVELLDVTAGDMVTGTPTVTGVANPYVASGLMENNDYAFYVRSDCGGGTFSNWAGPFAFSTLETCPTPSGLDATNITETSADLDWIENGVATSWNIELVDITAGGTATGTATATGVMNPYAATGLVGDNAYEFYVQADCGVDGTSAWAGPFAFATPYVAVPPTCSNGTFLDSGGQSGNYSSNENITYTICPDNPGDAVSVEFTAFSTENFGASDCYDGLTIYDGADATATTIDPPGGGTRWCWDRSDPVPAGTGDLQGMTLVSTDASGCLTFVFTSDGSVTREGWEAIVTCDPSLSVDTLANENAFTYFPNPVKNELVLNAQKEISNVAVFNLLGQEVLTIQPNTIDPVIDMNGISQGAYFVRVTIGNTTQTIRVIKQ